jgi:hypothetical protein
MLLITKEIKAKMQKTITKTAIPIAITASIGGPGSQSAFATKGLKKVKMIKKIIRRFLVIKK